MTDIKGIIFDYGGTIDTNGIHWGEMIWQQYIKAGLEIDKKYFREAYIHGERTLAKEYIIKPHHTFRRLLEIKTAIQFDYLKSSGVLPADSFHKQNIIADGCYNEVIETLKTTRSIIENLAKKYPLVLVTNFYGNMPTVLNEFLLKDCFIEVIESSVVGIRKPDPRLFALGVDKLKLSAKEVLVIGDSYRKDIAPALSLGCKAVWLKNICWEEEAIEADKKPTIIIEKIQDLTDLL